jgi:ethanolamine ammonia-lyase small subunit
MKRPPVGTPTWTDADDAKLRSLAADGLSSREIATEINRSLNAVQARSKKLGISLQQVMIRRRRKT